MSLFEQFPGELKLPELTPLPDGRYRMVRYLQFPAPKYTAPEYGSLFERDAQLTGDEATRYSGMRLINVDPSTVPGKQSVPALILTYEQIHATAETQVGKLITVTDENERDVVQAKFIQFSSATRTRGTIGSTTPPGVTTAVLDNEQVEDEGILRKITRRYVQAGAAFAQVGEDDIDYELNGLKRLTRNLVAKAGVPFPGVTGTDTHPTDTALILASLSIRESAATTKVKATYLEPGVVSKRRTSGEIIGTISNTWLVWHSDPTTLMTSALGTITPIADSIENVQGFSVRSLTALSGTITGLKTSYKTVAEVRTPGTITPTQFSAVSGEVYGTTAALVVVPPRVKTIPVTVEVSITTTPPNAAEQLAYNLESISASATTISQALTGNGIRDLYHGDGTIGFRGARYSADISAGVSSYPGHYYTAASATGTISYNSDWTDADRDATDYTILPVAQGSTKKITITCSGSSSPGAGYFTTGVLQRKARPVLTDLNGVTYWEIVTFNA